MEHYYTNERNAQMLIALMKAHNVRKVIASPGTTNLCLVASLQQDPYFEMYSSADERSAAYMACGLAAESGEPVALSCTGATASRNYLPALTEAYYRKLPILAITSTQHTGRVGNHIEQVIDRSVPLNDIVNLSIQIPNIHDDEDEWAYGVQMNKALLELRHRGGGPVHINLTTTYSKDFSVKELPPVKAIQRICEEDSFPKLADTQRIGIFVGAHVKWSTDLLRAVDMFCEQHNAVVLCDHTSNYKGKYGIPFTLVDNQFLYYASCRNMDIIIHIGEITGTFYSCRAKHVWRVSPDGEVRDTFRRLQYVFEMREIDFFTKYITENSLIKIDTFCKEWNREYTELKEIVPELPFSNVWMAQVTASKLPDKSVLHLGILNTLRVWDFFAIPKNVLGYSNTGGFGIDGCLSAAIGASLADREKIYFCVIGDLAFFYDMNSLGNRHIGNNIRILLVNNGRGTEFRNYSHMGAAFGDLADAYIAAAGHYGNQSADLVKHYAEDLGFEYLCATDKKAYLNAIERFLLPDLTDRPMLLEAFVDYKKESDALEIMNHLKRDNLIAAKKMAKDILGEKGVHAIKKVIKSNGK